MGEGAGNLSGSPGLVRAARGSQTPPQRHTAQGSLSTNTLNVWPGSPKKPNRKPRTSTSLRCPTPRKAQGTRPALSLVSTKQPTPPRLRGSPQHALLSPAHTGLAAHSCLSPHPAQSQAGGGAQVGWPAWMSPWGLCLWLVGRAAGRRCPRQSVPLTAVGFVAAGARGGARQQSLGRRHGGQEWGCDSGVKTRLATWSRGQTLVGEWMRCKTGLEFSQE